MRTITPEDSDRGQLISIHEALKQCRQSGQREASLRIGTDQRIDLSPAVADILATVSAALAQGDGVTIVPRDKLLTTQQAAEILGITRPTLIKALERGDIAFEMRASHRRIRLEDVIAYQERVAVSRAKALEILAREAQDDDLYDLLDTPPGPTR